MIIPTFSSWSQGRLIFSSWCCSSSKLFVHPPVQLAFLCLLIYLHTCYSNLPKLSISHLLIASHDPSLHTNIREKLNPLSRGSMHPYPLLSKPFAAVFSIPSPAANSCTQPLLIKSFLETTLFTGHKYKKKHCDPVHWINHQDLLNRLDCGGGTRKL